MSRGRPGVGADLGQRAAVAAHLAAAHAEEVPQRDLHAGLAGAVPVHQEHRLAQEQRIGDAQALAWRYPATVVESEPQAGYAAAATDVGQREFLGGRYQTPVAVVAVTRPARLAPGRKRLSSPDFRDRDWVNGVHAGNVAGCPGASNLCAKAGGAAVRPCRRWRAPRPRLLAEAPRAPGTAPPPPAHEPDRTSPSAPRATAWCRGTR